MAGFVSPDAVGSQLAKRKSGACRGPRLLGARVGLALKFPSFLSLRSKTANAFSLWRDLSALMQWVPSSPSAKAAPVGAPGARRASLPRPESSVASRNPSGTKDVRIGNAGSRATQSRQPRQVRKEATVTG